MKVIPPRSRQRKDSLNSLLRDPRQPSIIAGGIAFIICAVLIVMAFMDRVKDQSGDEIERMGANVVTVTAQPSQRKGGKGRRDAVVKTMTSRDVRDIQSTIPGTIVVTPEYRGNAVIKAGNINKTAPVSGVDASYETLREAPMARGRFFTEDEDRYFQRVAVLGAEVAELLFPGEEPVDRIIWISRIPFNIIGVLPERGSGMDAFEEDGTVFVPLGTAQRRLFQVSWLHRIYVRVNPEVITLEESVDAITALLHSKRRTNLELATPDFRVETQQRLIDLSIQSATRFQLVGAGILSLLLMAGTWGTYTIQNSAISERMSEIGTRRALGASAGDIFSMFLFETGVVCALGGLAGLLSALGGAYLVSQKLSPQAAAIAIGSCLVACLGAAIVPVWRATRMQPAHILRR